MRDYRNYLGLAIGLMLLSCLSEPKSHEASTGEAEIVLSDTEEAEKFYLTGLNYITWIGTKPTGRHTGTIRISQGFISAEKDQIAGGRFIMDLNDIRILDLESDPPNHDKLSNHLRSADFFDVENYPLGSFVLTRLEPYSASGKKIREDTDVLMIKSPTHWATGNLSLRDSTLSITFPAKIAVNDTLIHFMANFNIDRTRWGISYRDETKVENKIKDKFIHNKVNIGFDLKIEK